MTMSTSGNAIPSPAHNIRFRDADSIAGIERLLRLEAAKLEREDARISECRVKAAHNIGGQKGKLWNFEIDLTAPGGEMGTQRESSRRVTARGTVRLVAGRGIDTKTQRQILQRAVRGAVRWGRRELRDDARGPTAGSKVSTMMHRGRIFEVFAEKGCGVLRTPEGREICFHRDSVLDYPFEELKPGTAVAYAEGAGETGIRASRVRVLGRRGSQPTAQRRAA